MLVTVLTFPSGCATLCDIVGTLACERGVGVGVGAKTNGLLPMLVGMRTSWYPSWPSRSRCGASMLAVLVAGSVMTHQCTVLRPA